MINFFLRECTSLLDLLGGDNEDEAYQSRLDIGGNILKSMMKMSINREKKIMSFKIRNRNEEDMGIIEFFNVSKGHIIIG